MFSVHTGPFRVLEASFVGDLQVQRKSDSLASILVLSPSGRLLTHLQSRLAAEQPGFLNIHFLTFYALAERLVAGAGYTEQVVTEPALVQEMIRGVLTGDNPEPVDRAIRDALHMEGKPVPRGLAGALAATMKDLRDAGMRADKALQATQEGFLGKEAPEAAATLALYGRLIGLFEKKELRSSADLLRRAAKEAPAHPWLKQQKAIYLYGFYDLTGVQLDLVLSLASHPNAHVYFPYEKGNPAYAYAEKLLNDPAFVGKMTPSPLVGESRSPKATRDGGSPPPELRSSSPTRGEEAKCQVWSCSGARDEVWLAAKEILKLMDEGMPLREIAVVTRNLTPYLSVLREIFPAHEIPYVSSRGEPAGSHPLVKTIWALVTFDEKHPYTKTLLQDLNKSPYLRLTPGFAAPLPTGEGINPRESLSCKERDGVAQGEAKPWNTHILRTTEIIQKSIHLPKDATDEEHGLLDAILVTLDELKILDVLNRGVTREHFLDAWQEKLDLLARPAPGNHDGVQVLEVQQARGLPFGAVILLGMNEKVFPRLIREDPFLSDKARSALAQATGCRLGRKLDGYNEERFLFELMRQAPSRQLSLFTQRSDEEGKARIPSVYLKELEHSIPNLKPLRLPRSTAEKFEKRGPHTWTPKELSFLMNRDSLVPEAEYAALGWDVPGYLRLLAAHRTIETFRTGLGPHDGVLADPRHVQKVLEAGFSPTSLEDLAQCPFQYYAGHVLRVPVDEDLAPDGEMTPMALGKLFHKTLEIFYTGYLKDIIPTKVGTQNSDWAPAFAGVTAALQKAADECFREFAGQLSTVYPLALRVTKELVVKELSTFLKSDLDECSQSGYIPRWFEQPMDGTLVSGGLPYSFHGKPDRLDIKAGGITEVRVVDYKSGKPKLWTGRIETQMIQGRFLQLPIYLGLAGAYAQKALGKPAVATMATLRLVRESDEEAAEKSLKADFWASPSAPVFIENIRELIGIIEKEKFYIEPSTGEWGYCARCDFARICRKEHMPTRIRAERDPLRVRVNEKLSRVAPKDTPSPLVGEGRAPKAPGDGGTPSNKAAPHLNPPPRGGRRTKP